MPSRTHLRATMARISMMGLDGDQIDFAEE
jgi:hypothetical protein